LHTLYKSTFTIGDVKNRWIATKRREHILANARAKSEKTTEADEATMEQIIHQANEAKAGIIRGLVDALLEWCKQHGGSAAQTSHRPIYDPSVSAHIHFPPSYFGDLPHMQITKRPIYVYIYIGTLVHADGESTPVYLRT